MPLEPFVPPLGRSGALWGTPGLQVKAQESPKWSQKPPRDDFVGIVKPSISLSITDVFEAKGPIGAPKDRFEGLMGSLVALWGYIWSSLGSTSGHFWALFCIKVSSLGAFGAVDGACSAVK